ncbi:hypothetical protein C8A01DRAFT_45902 [Parachaetomium inaequale]|uniref:WSC domain-containing protein n=1 Tax=Parachaetomium inaequale TaxID=2588326 RepID=A0AAN6PGY8_9PEZI|nr:hypothetical protein C8A01DRAFT_45902 [Parachaetomium inaequale]
MKSMVLVATALVALADALPENSLPSRSWTPGGIVARYLKGVQKPAESPDFDKTTVKGCFNSSGELVYKGKPEYNTDTKCGDETCRANGFPVGGTMGGNQCWCGQTYPPEADLVDDSHCDYGCAGYPQLACGGVDFWTIYNTGIDLKVDYMDPSKRKTTSSGTSTPTSTSSTPEQTSVVLVTQSPTNAADSDGGSSSSGPNVAGIAAGVVVGVVIIAAAIGGGFFYMRRKRNQEIEEEHRRNAAVNAFIGKPPRSSGGTSTMDSRMDPVMAHRRMSDGSIADNQDYSRRILRDKVTNA